MCISISFCLVSIRFSWRVRRKARLTVKGRRPDGMVGTRHGREAERSSVHRSVQRSDERSHSVDLHQIPEESKSQRGREKEPPVIIGDPADSNVLVQDSMRRSSSRTSARQVESASQLATPRSSRQTTQRFSCGPDDIPSRNSLDLRTIPLIPQEDSDDLLFAPSPSHSQSRSPSRSRPCSHQNIPTHPPVHILPYP